ncbi:Zinc finger MYM-type protein 1 [Anthophora retusa]
MICTNGENAIPVQCLNILRNMHDSFPNLAISLRILLTIPISTATAERSFSKLKLIKNYLRTTMSQERLTNLTLLFIEHEICEKLNCDDLVKDFAEIKARKINIS